MGVKARLCPTLIAGDGGGMKTDLATYSSEIRAACTSGRDETSSH